MLADFIASIKSDRKLSFKNWRYYADNCPAIEIVTPEDEIIEGNV